MNDDDGPIYSIASTRRKARWFWSVWATAVDAHASVVDMPDASASGYADTKEAATGAVFSFAPQAVPVAAATAYRYMHVLRERPKLRRRARHLATRIEARLAFVELVQKKPTTLDPRSFLRLFNMWHPEDPLLGCETDTLALAIRIVAGTDKERPDDFDHVADEADALVAGVLSRSRAGAI